MNLKSVIVDDEAHSRSLLKDMLKEYCPGIDVVAEADNAQVARDMIEKHAPDILFLDIQMPAENGFDLLQSLSGNVTSKTVFVTAYSQFAIQALRANAFDYIVKPLNPNEIRTLGIRLQKHFSDQKRGLSKNDLDHHLLISHGKGFKLVSQRDIIRLEADNNYTTIYLCNGSRIVASKTIKEFENKVNADWFFRTHRSHIINLFHFSEFVSDEGSYALMSDGSKVDISRYRLEEFLANIHAIA